MNPPWQTMPFKIADMPNSRTPKCTYAGGESGSSVAESLRRVPFEGVDSPTARAARAMKDPEQSIQSRLRRLPRAIRLALGLRPST